MNYLKRDDRKKEKAMALKRKKKEEDMKYEEGDINTKELPYIQEDLPPEQILEEVLFSDEELDNDRDRIM